MSKAADRAEFELSRVKDRVAKLEKRMLSGISSSVLASWREETLEDWGNSESALLYLLFTTLSDDRLEVQVQGE